MDDDRIAPPSKFRAVIYGEIDGRHGGWMVPGAYDSRNAAHGAIAEWMRSTGRQLASGVYDDEGREV